MEMSAQTSAKASVLSSLRLEAFAFPPVGYRTHLCVPVGLTGAFEAPCSNWATPSTLRTVLTLGDAGYRLPAAGRQLPGRPQRFRHGCDQTHTLNYTYVVLC